MNKIKSNKTLAEFFKYSIVGLFSILIDFICYIILSEFNIFSVSISKRISFILGSINSFIGNKLFTFNSRRLNLREPILFIIIYVISFFANSFIHDQLFLYIDGIYPFLFATLTSIIINFLGQKYIVFKK